MNIVIKSDFQFSVTSIRYAPNGELCIELSSENGNPKNRYQYTADLGSGQAEEKPLVSLVDYSRKFMENSRIKEKSKDPYNQMARFLEAYGDCTIDKITTEYLQGFISHLQTEDNRLTNIVDDGYFSYYAYDHSGERVLKLTGHNTVLDINADDAQFYSYVDEVTLYTSPYLVANNYGYTKHYYAGTERVCASIGNGNLNRNGDFIDDDVSDYITTTYLYTNCIEAMNDRVLSWNPAADVLTSCGNTLTSFPHILDPIPVNIFAQTLVNTDPFNDAMDIYSNTTQQSEEPFFYHSDHLGSASWITDNGGLAVQHLQYLPYGERYVDQRISGYSERFTFTGKERDEETGYGYFGARYMDHELMTMWLSVDPMANKYPSISPYAYCAWNPVKLVDPDGRDWYDLFDDGTLVRNDNKSKEYQNSDVIWSVSNKSMSDEFSLGTLHEQKRDEKNGVKGSYISLQGSREENVAVFEFCSDNSNVEFSLMEIASSEDASYTILTTSHNERKVGVPSTDNYGTEFAKSEFYNLISHLHNHIGQASPSGDNNSGDISFRNKIDRLRELSGQTTRVLWGIYKCRGKEKYTKDYDGNTIDPITMRPF